MKLVATVTNCEHRAGAGGDIERRSAVIDIGDDLPSIVLKYLAHKKWVEENPTRFNYETLTFSILEEG